jgi:hypothetical protein
MKNFIKVNITSCKNLCDGIVRISWIYGAKKMRQTIANDFALDLLLHRVHIANRTRNMFRNIVQIFHQLGCCLLALSFWFRKRILFKLGLVAVYTSSINLLHKLVYNWKPRLLCSKTGLEGRLSALYDIVHDKDERFVDLKSMISNIYRLDTRARRRVLMIVDQS